MPDIKPSRENWSEFCEEPALSNAEWREWRDLLLCIKGDDVKERLYAATEDEWRALVSANREPHGPDWSGFVGEADANRRLMRAELEWMREHVG